MTGPSSARSSARVTNLSESLQRSAAMRHNFAGDSCAASIGTSPRGRYLTPRRISQLEASLTARDQAVLTTLARVRVASAKQLYRLHFVDITRRQARACLASLADRRLIARLSRVVGGARAGSTGYVFALDTAGQRLTRLNHDRTRRPSTVGHTFLNHSLHVTELYVQLVEANRAGRLKLAEFTTEPACWHRFYGPGGVPTMLKPDAATRLVLDRFEDHWWIEADLGTESSTALTRKCNLYRQYWQTGVEQARLGTYPKVLWLVPDEHRHSVLVDVIGRQPTEAWPLFAVALFTSAVARLLRGAGL